MTTPTDFLRASGLILGLVCLPAGMLTAEEHSTDTPVPMSLTVKTELPRMVPQMHRAYVSAETNKFAFLIPEGFNLVSEPVSGILKFSNLSGSAMITFRVVDPPPLIDGQLKPEACRERLLTLHPKGRILDEFSGNAASRTGPAFDMAWKTAVGGEQCTRTIFIPFEGGVLEFTATAGPEKFSSVQHALSVLTNTFAASDKQGKLEVTLLSDKL